MKLNRILNLTTGYLHTTMDDIYNDIEYITGELGIMTHQLPSAAKAIRDYLIKFVPEKYFESKFFGFVSGEIDVPPMDESEKDLFFKRFYALRDNDKF